MMSQTLIFWPVFAMIVLSYAVGMLMLRERIRAVKQGLSPAYFLHNKGGKLPDGLIQVSQHYENLFEIPVLFYIACIAIYVTGHVNILNTTLAWTFVVSRGVHAYIHITHNRLRVRRNTFLVGIAVLLIMWVDFMLIL